MRCFFIVIGVAVAVFANAGVSSFSLSTKAKVPGLRWLLDVTPTAAKFELKEVKKSSLEFELAQIKVDQVKEQYKSCFLRTQKTASRAKEIEPWIVLVGLQCLLQGIEKDKSLIKNLEAEIKRVQLHTDWIYQGPYAPAMRNQIIDSALVLANIEIKGSRAKAWQYVDILFSYLQHTSAEQKAKYFEIIGDLTFIEQKWQAALDYYKKGAASKDSAVLQAKIEKLKSDQKIANGKLSKESEEAPPAVLSIELSELEGRMLSNFKSGNIGSAVEDSVEIVKKFPETRSSEIAGQKLIEALFLVLEEADEKYLSLRDKVISLMMGCQADKVGRWAKLLYSRGQYRVSFEFASRAINRLDGIANTLDLLELAALAAEHIGNLEESISNNKKIIEKYVGTSAFRDAYFRLGINYYRKKEFSRALSSFEGYLRTSIMSSSSGGNGNGNGNGLTKELGARYWRVRALQKLGKPEAESEATALIEKYPISYYGILLHTEKNNSQFKLPVEGEQEIKSEFWLVGEHEKSWKRLQLLLNAGWLDESQSELKHLPLPSNIQQKIVLSRYYAAALEYPMAVKWITEAWDEDQSFRQRSFLQMVYPREFYDSVNQFSEKNKLDSDLVLSLIRQESAFSPKVVSRSGALGLMQLIPVTADEVAKDLSFKSLKIPEEVFLPKINIQMGTHYLAKMMKRYSGTVPLALAAYNAGPTRLDRWLVSKGLLKEIVEKSSWTTDDDLWIEELPWSETNFYVKSILRNLIIYRSLKTEQALNISFPVWK